MSSDTSDISELDDISFPYIFEKNVSVPLISSRGVVRCNVFRPKGVDKAPVIVTYGPYGKDLPYEKFHPKSWAEINPEHKSAHSAWETPDPGYWTKHGYIVVRADERGLGQSPGFLDTMSRGTSEAFFDVIEWSAVQPWSSGKVGLLGVSYYAGSQWRVAARQPRGLACIIPWEGMSDYYRDRCRHGGILSNVFIDFWWTKVGENQYGKEGGRLSEEELRANRNEQGVDNRNHQYRNEEYYASKEYNMGDIQVPLLSVGNWGGTTLHLRGNIQGFMRAGSKLKYLRMITGRHDLPFYYKEEAEVQRSFLDAFLKGQDRVGWSVPGKVPPVDLILRKGDIGYNNTEAEKVFERRTESAWPITRTQYTKFYLTPELLLTSDEPYHQRTKLSYAAPGTLQNPQTLQFHTTPFLQETEITGHITAHLNLSMSPHPMGPTPTDIDVFLTLRYISPAGKEVYYTGSAGDPVPLCKGWLRLSLRKVNKAHPDHQPWLPARNYLSTDVRPVIPGEIYSVDVEVWPTNVIVEKGGKIVLEVSSGDTQGCGIFRHEDSKDRSEAKFCGLNHLHFSPSLRSYVVLPIIPPK